MLKKISVILLTFFVFFSCFNASEVDLISDKYILYNMNDKTILLEKDSKEKTNVASLTKIMTVIVAIENIDDFNEKVKITKNMLADIEWDVSVAGFKVGDNVTYNDLLYGAMLPSGADATNALAISISGSLKDYVKLMNNKVKELDLKNTHFENVTGLYNENHYSSAYDMSQILMYALKNKKFKEVFEASKYTSTNNIKMKSTISKYNQNNSDISYITGAKTGYISKAGYCLASTAKLNDVNYLLITLNAFNDKNSPHIKDAIKTYKYYDNNYEYKNIINEEDVVVTLKTKYAKEKEIDIYSNVSRESYLKKDTNKENIKYDYKGIDEISYFMKKGTKLGNVNIIYEEEILDSFELIYNSELTFSIWLLLWDYKVYILCLILLILLVVRIKKVNKRRRKRRRIVRE